MNALLRKEFRMLLPVWPIGLLLTLVIWLIPNETNSRSPSALGELLVVFPFVASPLLAVMLALSSFGRELSGGTFSFLLSQPMERSRVWRTKTLLLAVALAVLLAVWLFSFFIHFREKISIPEWDAIHLRTIAVFFTLTIYSGALWTVLFFRQVAAAFWFTLIVPAALMMGVIGALQNHPDHLRPVLIVTFSLYSVAGFLFARWMFLRAQDVQWTGGVIALPEWRWRRTDTSIKGRRAGRSPLRALFVKEFQLHQSQFVIAGVIALLHLAVIATRKWGGEWKNSSVVDVVLNIFWITWLAMPWLVGCAAVAEERKLGTLEAQLCLPARRRTQFLIKFVSTMLVALLLGAVMPVLFEGTRISPAYAADSSNYTFRHGSFVIFVDQVLTMFPVLLPFLICAGFTLGFAIVSFYVSSFSRNTLQAIAPAALGIMATWFLWMWAAHSEQIVHYPLWRGPLIFILGAPVMTLTLVGLMYGNFKRVLVDWNVWRRNTFVFLGALAGVSLVTTTLYHRPWQLFGALESAHGSARLKTSDSVALRTEFPGLSALLPDGRSWATQLKLSVPQDFFSRLAGDVQVGEETRGGKYLEGTNWAGVARGIPGMIGIQKDGSLWIGEPVDILRRHWLAGRNLAVKPLVRLGTDNDWKSVTYQHAPAFLLKTDGTLWRLGTNRMNGLKEWPGFLNFIPERLGTDSDWEELSSEAGRVIFRKTDGRAWALQPYGTAVKNAPENIDLNAETVLYRLREMDDAKSGGIWISARSSPPFAIGVFSDGSFRKCARWATVRGGRVMGSNPQLIGQDSLIGTETNWVTLAGGYGYYGDGLIVTLKADGTLWKWEFPDDQPQHAKARRLSTHSDWVAVASAMDGVIALSADGGLWFWRSGASWFSGARYPNDSLFFTPWFAPSRRPQLIGNLFAASGQ